MYIIMFHIIFQIIFNLFLALLNIEFVFFNIIINNKIKQHTFNNKDREEFRKIIVCLYSNFCFKFLIKIAKNYFENKQFYYIKLEDLIISI